MRHIYIVGLVVISLGVASSPYALAADPNEFSVFSYNMMADASVELPGRLFVPADYNPDQAYPIVVFLHGVGEGGSNNTSQVNGNINNILAAAKNRDFILYAPQSLNGFWSANEQKRIINMLGEATTNYNIDTSRIYVTGLSGGGGGTWKLMESYGEVFAAAVPIAGSESDLSLAANLVGKPIWAFHAQNDGTVGVGVSRTHINAIRAADGGKPPLVFPLNANPANPYYNTGAPYYADGSTFYSENNLRYTEYATGNHGIWGRVYNEQPMYDWMLAQSNPIASLAEGKTILFDLGNVPVTAPDSQGRIWNSPDTASERSVLTSVGFALDSQGTRTTVNLRVHDTFTFRDTIGVTPGSLYDPNISSDNWYTGAASNASALNAPGIIVLNGLVPGGQYKITLFASNENDDGGRGRITRYIIGEDYRDLDIVNNLDRSAVFASVIADAAGLIQLTVSVPPGTTSRYGSIGVLELTAVNLNPIPEPASLSLLLTGSTAALLARKRPPVLQ